jgi:hypothetical protein
MPRCVADIFIVHGFVVNNAVLLCGFKQTKGKRYENSDFFDRTAAGIGGSVCVNYLCPVEAVGGGMTKDEALDLALEALEAHADIGIKSDKAITAIKQARALDKKAENTMIYRTFEQWKNGNVLEHGVPRTEYYSEDQLDLVEMGWNYGYDAGRAVEQALDKKAENARELGLDYEPVQEPVAWMFEDDEDNGHKTFRQTPPSLEVVAYLAKWNRPAWVPLYTTPPAAQRQWVGLTDEEVYPLANEHLHYQMEGYEVSGIYNLARAIEARLKELNI